MNKDSIKFLEDYTSYYITIPKGTILHLDKKDYSHYEYYSKDLNETVWITKSLVHASLEPKKIVEYLRTN